MKQPLKQIFLWYETVPEVDQYTNHSYLEAGYQRLRSMRVNNYPDFPVIYSYFHDRYLVIPCSNKELYNAVLKYHQVLVLGVVQLVK